MLTNERSVILCWKYLYRVGPRWGLFTDYLGSFRMWTILEKKLVPNLSNGSTHLDNFFAEMSTLTTTLALFLLLLSSRRGLCSVGKNDGNYSNDANISKLKNWNSKGKYNWFEIECVTEDIQQVISLFTRQQINWLKTIRLN